MRILVAYETKNGSTADVAQAIVSALRERGCDVDLRLARDVRDVTGLDGLVVGAPIYSGRWLSGAHRILKRTTKLPADERPPVAIFALGPRVDEGPESWVRPREQFQRSHAKHPSIAPVSTALFGGADPPRKTPRRDIRDWDTIRAWAGDISEAFGCPPSGP